MIIGETFNRPLFSAQGEKNVNFWGKKKKKKSYFLHFINWLQSLERSILQGNNLVQGNSILGTLDTLGLIY